MCVEAIWPRPLHSGPTAPEGGCRTGQPVTAKLMQRKREVASGWLQRWCGPRPLPHLRSHHEVGLPGGLRGRRRLLLLRLRNTGGGQAWAFLIHASGTVAPRVCTRAGAGGRRRRRGRAGQVGQAREGGAGRPHPALGKASRGTAGAAALRPVTKRREAGQHAACLQAGAAVQQVERDEREGGRARLAGHAIGGRAPLGAPAEASRPSWRCTYYYSPTAVVRDAAPFTNRVQGSRLRGFRVPAANTPAPCDPHLRPAVLLGGPQGSILRGTGAGFRVPAASCTATAALLSPPLTCCAVRRSSASGSSSPSSSAPSAGVGAEPSTARQSMRMRSWGKAEGGRPAAAGEGGEAAGARHECVCAWGGETLLSAIHGALDAALSSAFCQAVGRFCRHPSHGPPAPRSLTNEHPSGAAEAHPPPSHSTPTPPTPLKNPVTNPASSPQGL